MIEAVKQAILFADGKEHDGAGYTLLIIEASGLRMECDVMRWKSGSNESLLRVRNPDASTIIDLPDGSPYFPGAGAAVVVLW